MLGGQWLLRLEGGATRRANSVNLLRASAYDPRRILTAARTLYNAHGQPCLFRVPTIASGLDEGLEDLQFVASGEVLTLLARLDEATLRTDPEVEIAPEPSEAWLTAIIRLNPKVAAAPQPFRLMAIALLLPKGFVALWQAERIVGLAYGAIHEGLLVVEAVVVDPDVRCRGYGRRLVAMLMAWAQAEGAHAACLQVEADNGPALALYRSLGFTTELYRYHYRSEAGYRPPETVRIEPTA